MGLEHPVLGVPLRQGSGGPGPTSATLGSSGATGSGLAISLEATDLQLRETQSSFYLLFS